MFGQYGFFGLATVYTVAVAALCLRRGDAGGWLWIVLVFGPVGATIYLVSQFDSLVRPRTVRAPRPPAVRLRRAWTDAERLDTGAAWAECASLHGDRGRWVETTEAARRALAKEPDQIDALYDLGRALLARGEAAEARQAFERVVARRPDHGSGEALFALGRSLRGAGDFAAARARLEELAERSSRADFLFELATLQEQLGDRDAARATFRRIVDEFVFTPSFMRGRVRPWVWRARWRLWRLGSS